MARMCRKKHALNFLLVSGLFVWSGCFVPKYKNLQITVDSFPSGADVYGVAGLVPGEFIGKTPIVFVYVYKDGKIYGTIPHQTIEYNGAYLAFKCYLKKEGYGTYRMHEIINEASEDTEGNLRYAEFNGLVSYTAGLYHLRNQDKSRLFKDNP